MPKQTLNLLGPVRITHEMGTPPRFRSQRTIALLGYLAIKRGPTPRDTLVNLFWPNESLATGRDNLRRELHNLASVLPGCWQIDRRSVAFAPDIDTHVDLALLRQFEKEKQWTAGAEYAQGEFLEGVYLPGNQEFETWLLWERERWRQRVELVLIQAARSERALGSYDPARRYVAHLLRLAPWNEAGHREMMRLLAHSGQFSAALKQYQQCRAVLADELDVIPSEATTTLYESIKLAMTLPPHNLPPQATPLVGRVEELAILKRRLTDPDCRLLTLTGIGGIGKSRLALEVARRIAADRFRLFLHGVAFVPLVGVDRQELPAAIGAGLGIVFSGQQPPERQLVSYLQNLELLLLLDNYEHLLPDSSLLATILNEAPGIKLLVTSRERLHLREEWLIEVDGLSYPEKETEGSAGEEELEYDAVRLFASCARRLHRDFSRGTSEGTTWAICRLVQGMPLALELAAGQLKHLTIYDVLAELERGLVVLATDVTNMSPRHASMRAAFDSSWKRLSPLEQKALNQMSLFRGSFSRDAATIVLGASLPVFGRLIDMSLVRLMPTGRYEMHELLRKYAAEMLAADPALRAASRDAYVAYYSTFLQRREERLLATDQAAALREISSEIENIHRAWDWAVEGKQPGYLNQAVCALGFFYELRGRFPEGLLLMEVALEKLNTLDETKIEEASLRASLRLFQGHFLQRTGNPVRSQTILAQNQVLLSSVGSATEKAWAQCALARTHIDLGDLDGAIALFKEGVAISRGAGIDWLVAYLASNLAYTLAMVGDPAFWKESILFMNQSLGICQEFDNPNASFAVYYCYARQRTLLGEYERAEENDRLALEAAKQIDHLWAIGLELFYLGLDSYLQSRVNPAWKYYDQSAVYFLRTGDHHMQAVLQSAMGELARFDSDLAKASYLFRRGLEKCLEFDLTSLASIVYSMLGHVFVQQLKHEAAWACFTKSVSMTSAAANPVGSGTGMNLLGLAAVLASQGFLWQAAQLGGVAEAQIEGPSARFWPADRQDWKKIVTDIRENLDDETFTVAWEAGRVLPVSEAVALALASIHWEEEVLGVEAIIIE